MKKLILICVIGLSVLVSGCSATVSQQDYMDVLQDYLNAKQDYTDSQLEILKADLEISDLKTEIKNLQTDLENLQSDLEDALLHSKAWENEARSMKDSYDNLWSEYQIYIKCNSPQQYGQTLEEYQKFKEENCN